MHALSVEVFSHTLGNLALILEKAGANAAQRKFDTGVLLGARLAPDMLPLTRQVQIASDIAKNSVARLAGQEPPRFEDNESSIEQLRARIARTIDFLKSVPASALEGSETRTVKGAARRAHARIHRSGFSAALGASQRVLPRRDRLRHPASQRRRPRQARLRQRRARVLGI